MIVLLATLHAKPGRREELAGLLDAIRVDAEAEPGTLAFAVHTVSGDETAVVCYEAYADADAIAAHRDGSALQALMAVIGNLIDGAPEIVYLEPVSSASR